MDNNVYSVMYFTLTKDMVNTELTGVLLDKYKKAKTDEDGNPDGYTTPTWGDVIMLKPHRKSLNWTSGGAHKYKICMVRDQWSHINGEMSALLDLGIDKDYPYCSVLTNLEAKELMLTDKFKASNG